MKRWLLVFTMLLIGGCGHMEEMVFGPEPHVPMHVHPYQPTGSCNNPAVHTNVSQTQEPELLQVRK